MQTITPPCTSRSINYQVVTGLKSSSVWIISRCASYSSSDIGLLPKTILYRGAFRCNDSAILLKDVFLTRE